ncbi:FMN phosphatase YigB (HAD superfamily) [Pseudomonas nitroreducens]|nr:FMN phosphatase YigB (HAD superfamily) [Pseudomonas nitroreducens]
MHRSGTSALTRGLQALNVELGENLTPAKADNNEKGFWEDREVVAINELLLQRLGGDWDSLSLIDDRQLDARLTVDLEERAGRYLDERLEVAPLLGLKDPRISRLLPFWRRLLESKGIETSYVICVRHPLSVAQSLARRDGFSSAKSLALWQQHTLDSLSHTAASQRVVLCYEYLMGDPKGQLLRIASQLDLQPGSQELFDDYLNDFLDEQLQHSFHAIDDPELANQAPTALLELYELLMELAADRSSLEHPEPLSRLQALREQLDVQRDALALFHRHDSIEHPQRQALELSLETLRGESQAQLDEQAERLRFLVAELSSAQQRARRLESELDSTRLELKDTRNTVEEIQSSTSWLLTKPVRFTSRLFSGKHREALVSLRNYSVQLGRNAYWRLPVAYRDPMVRLVYRHMGFAFKGVPHYEQWRNLGRQGQGHGEGQSAPELVDLQSVPPCANPDGRIAIHLHLFYSDLAEEFRSHLAHMPYAYDLFVSVCDAAAEEVAQRIFSTLPNCSTVTVQQVENRGRDIAPFFCTFGESLRDYDYLLHLHSKKSLYNQGATLGWREYLCGSLLGSAERIRSLFTLLDSERCGIVYPQNYDGLPYMANTWLANAARGRIWAKRLGLAQIPAGYFHYPAGSMFWARSEALKPLFDAKLQLDDFEAEAGQRDGTLAHCLERLLTLSSQSQQLPIAILSDPQPHAWSPWGMHHYFARSHEHLRQSIEAPQTKAVAFDIFDTLLVRPLVNAESIKRLVAQQAGTTLGDLYLDYRASAEGRARERAGRDVGLDAIYDELQRLTGIKDDERRQLQSLEERIELASVSARPEAVELFAHARNLGKPVLLISDMFLPRSCIEQMLLNNGIEGWTAFYLSNEVGVRKDQGDLYRHVLDERQLEPQQLLMIGDNERSDFQIPDDLGIRTVHLLRPTELARGLPKFRPLVEDCERHPELDQELVLGLLLRRNFSPLTYAGLPVRNLTRDDAGLLGYNVLGPLLASFADWLRHTAQRDGIDQLHFLSREGKLIKAAYDLWCDGVEDAPSAHYLVLSRRAITMSHLSGEDDIQRMARPTYFANTLENFLESRFGYHLGAQRRQQLIEAGVWREDQLVEVIDNDTRALRPVLEALQGDLLEQAAGERPAMMAYLQSTALSTGETAAVVDVGYSGTIQAQLCGLLERPVQGYYFITDKDIGQVLEPLGAWAQGCFLDQATRLQPGAELYRQSFQLEKLLSADETQLLRYELDGDGRAIGRFLSQTEQERDACATRYAIQQGALAYVADARDLRERLHPGLRPPRELAQRLWALFIDRPSAAEDELLQRLTLDDHYCGRGYVS